MLLERLSVEHRRKARVEGAMPCYPGHRFLACPKSYRPPPYTTQIRNEGSGVPFRAAGPMHQLFE